MSNPFSPSFGREPNENVSRLADVNEVLENFNSEHPSHQVYMITGVRGSGKTVFMTTVSKVLEKESDWIVLHLNVDRDMLTSFAAKLYNVERLYPLFVNAKLDFSLLGIGIHIENATPVSDVEVAIERMLDVIKKQNKKVLITIDEVTSSQYMKIFASSFQIFMRQDYPVYMMMTGLYDNIYKLQNEDSLTFLYRAPKIELKSLNMTLITEHYKKVFDLDNETAQEFAAFTKGYPFAFQVLGYLLWNKDTKKLDDVITEYDVYLEEYSYDKIWSELSEKDKEVLTQMSNIGDESVKNQVIRSKMKTTSNQFTGYRDRLIKKGIVYSDSYAHLSFTLPRFKEFVQRKNIRY